MPPEISEKASTSERKNGLDKLKLAYRIVGKQRKKNTLFEIFKSINRRNKKKEKKRNTTFALWTVIS